MIYAIFIKNGFAVANLTLAILLVAFKNKKNDYFICFIKNVGLIKKFINKKPISLYKW